MEHRDRPLLFVRDLRRHIPDRRGRPIRAVDGVSFAVHRGEIFGLVGGSGSGKSTLARLVAGLDRPTSGAVLLSGRPVRGSRGPARSREVQILFQDAYAALDPRMRVEEIVTEGLRLPRRERRGRAAELLAAVGLPASAAAEFPYAFSGGQRQRIGLARAMAVDPDLLVADEPLSALDPSVQAQIVNLILDLRRRRGLACLFISHDLAMVRHICDRVAVMYLGRFVEVGPAASLADRALHPYTRALSAAAPSLDPRQARLRPVPRRGGYDPAPGAGCPFAPRCPHVRDRCRAEVPPLREITLEHWSACHFANGGWDPPPRPCPAASGQQAVEQPAESPPGLSAEVRTEAV